MINVFTPKGFLLIVPKQPEIHKDFDFDSAVGSLTPGCDAGCVA